MKLNFLIMFILVGIFVPINSSYAENNLKPEIFTRLIDLSISGESSMVFEGTGEIWNPNEANVSIGFPDSCKFEMRMYFEDNTRINGGSIRSCKQAMTSLHLPPGSIHQEIIQFSFDLDIDQFSKIHPSHRFKLELHFTRSHEDIQITTIGSYLFYDLTTSPGRESFLKFEYDDPPEEWGQVIENSEQLDLRVNGSNFRISIIGFAVLLFYKKKQIQ